MPVSPLGPSRQSADFKKVVFGFVAARDVDTPIEDIFRSMSL